ncbi:MAG: 16S rRNA (guanine(527)-N(7))-methyltransferase RsmG [Acidobacteriaceae bacterium]
MNAVLLAKMIQEAGLASLTPEALNRFDLYLDLLLKWNSRLNLTAIRDPETILRRHFVECIQCAQALPALKGSTLLDFGSGAGLPGIPIAICRPDIHVTLAESQQKKSAFLREAVRTLRLPATEVFAGRVENMPQALQFDIVALRAVDRMREACKAAFPRVRMNGRIVVFTTQETRAELKKALPAIESWNEMPSAGLNHGLLLIGQRPNPKA